MDTKVDRTQYHMWNNPFPGVYNYTVGRWSLFEPFWFERFDTIEYYDRYLNWRFPIFVLSLFYVLLSWLGPKWMKNREPFNLKTLFTAWNAGMGLFSIVALCRTAPDQLYFLHNLGFHRFVCLRDGGNEMLLFWGLLVLWSKFVQFGDTAFIILQKKPLPAVHVYHHAVMCYGAFHVSQIAEPLTRIHNLNLLVHSFFYNYRALVGMGMKFNKIVPKFILLLELIQALIVLFVSVYTTFHWAKGNCIRSIDSIIIYNMASLGMITLYMHFARDYLPSWKKTKDLKITKKTK